MEKFKWIFGLITLFVIIEIVLYNHSSVPSMNDYIELPIVNIVESNPLHRKPDISKIQSMIDNVTVDNTKYVQYICEKRCGGWGDRLKGIVSTFMLSLVLERKFLMKVEHPCDMKYFFKDYDEYWSEPIIDKINKKQLFMTNVSKLKFSI
jgi:tryptophanase